MTGVARAPRLSVLMTTYAHGRWIAQALQSVLDQRAGFGIEVVVGDDASPDDTRQVAERLALAHPSRVRVLPAEPRMGMHKNLGRCLRAARGEYAAILNGDDYWTSPIKAQRQVDALDCHAAWSMCFHPVTTVDASGTVLLERAGPRARPAYGTRDLLRSDIVPTCSAVFRRALVGPLPAWYAPLPMGDWSLWLRLSTRGALGYLDEPLAAYRVHAGGSWSGLPERDRVLAEIRFLTIASRYLGGRYGTTVSRSLSDRYYRLGREWMRAGDAGQAAGAFRQALAHRRLNWRAWRGLLFDLDRIQKRHHPA